MKSSHGFNRTVRDILVGGVWYLTGSTLLTSEWPYDAQGGLPSRDHAFGQGIPQAHRRQFLPDPPQRRFETGGGKYRTYWSPADFSKETAGVTMFAYEFAKALNRPGVPQGFMTMSAGRGGRGRQLASPLSWTSFQGVKDLKNPAFRARLDELFLQYPNSRWLGKRPRVTSARSGPSFMASSREPGRAATLSFPLAGASLSRAGQKRCRPAPAPSPPTPTIGT